MTTLYNVYTPERTESSLSNMSEWEWDNCGNFKDMCLHISKNSNREWLDREELLGLVSKYSESIGENSIIFDVVL